MPALAADAGSDATRAPPGPARLTARYWTDAGALDADTAQARMAITASSGWLRARYKRGSRRHETERDENQRTGSVRVSESTAQERARNIRHPVCHQNRAHQRSGNPVTCSSSGIR